MMTREYADLLSHALYKVNKLAKLVRDIYHSTYYDKYYRASYEFENRWYDKFKYHKDYFDFITWMQKRYPGYLDDEDIFCFQKGSEFFYDLKETVIQKLKKSRAIEIVGYHRFPDGAYTCFKFGKHTFHQPGIIDNAEYIGDIGGKISSCCYGGDEIPNWEEALTIIYDFIEDTNIYLDETIERLYSRYIA